MSDESREYRRERYAYLKSRCRCVVCRTQDENTLAGESRCAYHAAYGRAHHKRTAESRKAAGLCYVCGKNHPEPGFASCKECRIRRSQLRREKKMKDISAARR